VKRLVNDIKYRILYFVTFSMERVGPDLENESFCGITGLEILFELIKDTVVIISRLKWLGIFIFFVWTAIRLE